MTDVRFWPKADISIVTSYVRVRGRDCECNGERQELLAKRCGSSVVDVSTAPPPAASRISRLIHCGTVMSSRMWPSRSLK